MLQAKALKIALWLAYMAASAFLTARAQGADRPLPLPASDWQSAAPYDNPILRMGGRAESFVKVKLFGRLLGMPRENTKWRWSPARPHHACMVRLQVGSSCGSGVYISFGRCRAILTAKHVVEDGGQAVQVRWIDGKIDRGATVLYDRTGADLAVVRLRNYRSDVDPLPVSYRTPSAGEWLEVCGYGTGGTRLRNFYVRVASDQFSTDDTAQPGPVHGDSGGAIITADSKGTLMVCSAVSAGNHDDDPSTPDRVQGEIAYDKLFYARPDSLRQFVTRVHAKWGGQTTQGDTGRFRSCPPGGCPPQQQQPQPYHDQQLFPPEEPYRLGPISRGPNIDIDVAPRQRPAPYPQQPPSSAVPGICLVLGAAGLAGFIALGRRI